MYSLNRTNYTVIIIYQTVCPYKLIDFIITILGTYYKRNALICRVNHENSTP